MADSANKSAKESKGFSIGEFIAGVKAEYSKIIFPSKEDLKKETIATLICSVAIGLVIFVLDSGFTALLSLIL